MRTLDFGKNSGKCLQNCDESYLKWLVSHEKVLATRNQWASRDAKYILRRIEGDRAARAIAASKLERMQELAKTDFLAKMDLEMTQFIVTQKTSTDLSTKGNLYSNRGFQLMR